jgi:predicted Fe-Mo cluster-binding NifX family protein
MLIKIRKMKRVAIPITEGKLSEYFGKCCHYEIYEIDDSSIEKKSISKDNISNLPKWANENKITDIITHKIDNKTISLFTPIKVNIFIGISIDTPERIIDSLLKGKLISDKEIISELMLNK